MARLPRLALDQQLHYLTHRAATGRSIFSVDADSTDYLHALREVSRQSDVAIHAYVLLPQCVHLLLTPASGAGLAPMMQRLGRRFVAGYNRRHGVSGSPWAGRYRTGVLQPSLFLLEAMCRIETLPVALRLSARAEDWAASSASHHAGLRSDPIVTDHAIFWALGNTPFDRELAYRKLMETPLCESVATRIDEATAKGWAVGDKQFIDELSTKQARRLLPAKRGRRKTNGHEVV